MSRSALMAALGRRPLSSTKTLASSICRKQQFNRQQLFWWRADRRGQRRRPVDYDIDASNGRPETPSGKLRNQHRQFRHKQFLRQGSRNQAAPTLSGKWSLRLSSISLQVRRYVYLFSSRPHRQTFFQQATSPNVGKLTLFEWKAQRIG